MSVVFERGVSPEGHPPAHAVHGGDIEAVSREYGIPVRELIDFSASINPFGPPQRVMDRLQRESADASLLARYPEPGYSQLRAALATRFSVPPECLVIANGSAALFGAIVRALDARSCLVPVPAFSEQQRALEAAGCRIERFVLGAAGGFRLDAGALCEAIQALQPAMCLLTNPHNPSGALTSAVEMARVVRAAADCDVQLVIDEAFMDYAPTETLTGDVTRAAPNLVVVRSLTKFYGMPALRVGYCVAAPHMASRIVAQLPEWPVTTLAANAAAEALRDDEYARRTLLTVTDDRQHLREQLADSGVATTQSAANFLLMRLPEHGPDSTRLRAQLIRRAGVIVRDCRSFDGMADGRFVRVAVRSRLENERLVEAIRSALEEVRIDGGPHC